MARWMLLIYKVPPTPARHRIAVWRKLVSYFTWLLWRSHSTHPKDNNVLYAFSMQGVIKSEDRGHTWNFKNTGLTLSKNEFIFGFSFDTNDPNTIYASSDQKIFKTENAGESWRRIM